MAELATELYGIRWAGAPRVPQRMTEQDRMWSNLMDLSVGLADGSDAAIQAALDKVKTRELEALRT